MSAFAEESDDVGDEIPARSMRWLRAEFKVFQTLSGLTTTIRQLVGQNQASLACIHKILSDE
jgi:hypothetical protein